MVRPDRANPRHIKCGGHIILSSTTRILGVVLLNGRVILIIAGVTASRSATASICKWVTGHFTWSTMCYLIGGVVAAVSGFPLSFGVAGRSRS